MASWAGAAARVEVADGGFADRFRPRVRDGALDGPAGDGNEVEQLTCERAPAERTADDGGDLGDAGLVHRLAVRRRDPQHQA